MIRTFQIYSHSDFQIYNSIINSSHQAIHYISSNYLFYNWNFVSFDHFYPFAHPLPLPFLPRHPLLLYSRRKALRNQAIGSSQRDRPNWRPHWHVIEFCLFFWFVCFYFIEERRLICFFNYDGGFQAMPLMSNHCDHGRNFAIRKVNKICRIIPIKECWLISVSIAVTSCKF